MACRTACWLRRQPLHLAWVQQLVRAWNCKPAWPSRTGSWPGRFEDNLALMREGTDLAAGSPCWCRRWQQFLLSAPTDSGTIVWLTELDEKTVVERAAAAYLRQSLEPALTKPEPESSSQQPAAASSSQQHLPIAAAPSNSQQYQQICLLLTAHSRRPAPLPTSTSLA